MSRINDCFKNLKTDNRKALIPFITAGDPDTNMTILLMQSLVAAGADIIELGIPFSDPMADGPVIQRASERALKNGVSLKDVLTIVAEFRQLNKTTPIVLMGYLNPIEVMGYKEFAKAASEAGVDGVLIVDLPPEESIDLVKALKSKKIAPIFLLAPTTTPERIDTIARHAEGYLYYVSVKGITGSKNLDVKEVEEKVAEIRHHTKLPVGVGFGINSAERAAQVSAVSDAVIVGSAIVKQIEETQDKGELLENISQFVSDLRSAMDAVDLGTWTKEDVDLSSWRS